MAKNPLFSLWGITTSFPHRHNGPRLGFVSATVSLYAETICTWCCYDEYKFSLLCFFKKKPQSVCFLWVKDRVFLWLGLFHSRNCPFCSPQMHENPQYQHEIKRDLNNAGIFLIWAMCPYANCMTIFQLTMLQKLFNAFCIFGIVTEWKYFKEKSLDLILR